MAVSAETFERVVTEDQAGRWEIHRGRLREKPGLSFEHNELLILLTAQFAAQIDWQRFTLRSNAGHVRRGGESTYVPDLFVLPRELTAETRGRRSLETYDRPVALVVEIWSPSTGLYDIDEKLSEYRRRGDREIWRFHPYDKTLRAWRRQDDGGYQESAHSGGTVSPVALPDVAIDLDALFAAV
jgi:Uma2 family endonuclease